MAVVLGDAPSDSLGAYGASRVFQVAGDFSLFSGRQTADALHAAIQASGADVALASSSYQAKDTMPCRRERQQGQRVHELRTEGGRVIGRRPAYAGRCLRTSTSSRHPRSSRSVPTASVSPK